MEELRTSLQIISAGGKILAFIVGGFILVSFSLVYIDLRYRGSAEFKRVFGKSAKRMSSEEVNQRISAEYEKLLALEKKAALVRAKLEIEQLDGLISESRERIGDMDRLARVNKFALSDENLKIIRIVERQIVKYSAPAAA